MSKEEHKWFWYMWLKSWVIFTSDLEYKIQIQEEEVQKNGFKNIRRDL